MKKKIVIVPRGAGSGFTGGALPSSGGIVLAFEKTHEQNLRDRYEKKHGCHCSTRCYKYGLTTRS